ASSASPTPPRCATCPPHTPSVGPPFRDSFRRTRPTRDNLPTATRGFRQIFGQESGNPRAFGPGLMIYWHVERKSVCIYSQLKHCSASEVAAMIEGVLRHCTDA